MTVCKIAHPDRPSPCDCADGQCKFGLRIGMKCDNCDSTYHETAACPIPANAPAFSGQSCCDPPRK